MSRKSTKKRKSSYGYTRSNVELSNGNLYAMVLNSIEPDELWPEFLIQWAHYDTTFYEWAKRGVRNRDVDLMLEIIRTDLQGIKEIIASIDRSVTMEDIMAGKPVSQYTVFYQLAKNGIHEDVRAWGLQLP